MRGRLEEERRPMEAKHRDGLEAMNAAFELRRAAIVQEFEQEAEILRAEGHPASELA